MNPDWYYWWKIQTNWKDSSLSLSYTKSINKNSSVSINANKTDKWMFEARRAGHNNKVW
jgi:hypothetical protein